MGTQYVPIPILAIPIPISLSNLVLIPMKIRGAKGMTRNIGQRGPKHAEMLHVCVLLRWRGRNGVTRIRALGAPPPNPPHPVNLPLIGLILNNLVL